MIVLDTHVWIWWNAAPKNLSRIATNALARATSIGVSAVSCWELTLLISKGRLSLDRDLLEWMTDALAVPRVELLPLTPAVAVRAMNLELHGDPGDRLIAATANLHDAVLVTKDEKLRTHSVVRTLW